MKTYNVKFWVTRPDRNGRVMRSVFNVRVALDASVNTADWTHDTWTETVRRLQPHMTRGTDFQLISARPARWAHLASRSRFGI